MTQGDVLKGESHHSLFPEVVHNMFEVSDCVVSLHVLKDHIGPTLHWYMQERIESWVGKDLRYFLDGREGGREHRSKE